MTLQHGGIYSSHKLIRVMQIGSKRRQARSRVIVVTKGACPDKGKGLEYRKKHGYSKRTKRLYAKHGLDPASSWDTAEYNKLRKKRKTAEKLVRAKKHLMAKAERVGKVRTKRIKVVKNETKKR